MRGFVLPTMVVLLLAVASLAWGSQPAAPELGQTCLTMPALYPETAPQTVCKITDPAPYELRLQLKPFEVAPAGEVSPILSLSIQEQQKPPGIAVAQLGF